MSKRYTLPAFWRAVKEPGRLVGEARRIGIKLNSFLQNTDTDPFDIMGADWDILIILDGCRFDLFESESTLEGATKSIKSGASQSVEFMETHFYGHTYHDTVYVSANPFTKEIKTGVFYDIKKAYRTHWDEKLETVKPDDLAEVAIEAADEFPQKRLIVHFMQPHHPFIGDVEKGFKSGSMKLGSGDDVWTQLQNLRCPVDESTVWKAYAENYTIVEGYVEQLQSKIMGKTIVTSDHGNLIGERLTPIPIKAYGHPYGIYHKKLRTVPWHKFPVNSRRNTIPEEPKKVSKDDRTEIGKQLQALGYK